MIHLYAPAFCVGSAALLAMPGQLSWERWVDGHSLTVNHMLVAVLPALAAVVLRALALNI